MSRSGKDISAALWTLAISLPMHPFIYGHPQKRKQHDISFTALTIHCARRDCTTSFVLEVFQILFFPGASWKLCE